MGQYLIPQRSPAGIATRIKAITDEIMAEGKEVPGVIEGGAVPRIVVPRLVYYY